MIINQPNLEALRTGFRTEFQAGIAVAAPVSGPMTTEITSTTKIETYGFLGDMPIFRRWIGEKRIRSIREKAYTLTNQDFEATWGIHKNKIRDDSLGLYAPMVRGWGQDAGALRDRLVFSALAAGINAPCFDGQNFFDADHPIGEAGAVASNMSGAAAVQPWYLLDLSKPLKPLIYQNRQSPVFTMVVDEQDSHVFKTGEFLMGGEARGAGGYAMWQTAHRTTAAVAAAGYEAAYTAMTSLTNDEGEPLEIRPTHVVFGPSNRAAVKTMFEAQNQAGGASNIYYKDVQLIESVRLP